MHVVFFAELRDGRFLRVRAFFDAYDAGVAARRAAPSRDARRAGAADAARVRAALGMSVSISRAARSTSHVEAVKPRGGTAMRVMVLIKANEQTRSRRDAERAAADRDDGVQRGARQGGRDARRRGPAPELQGRPAWSSRAASARSSTARSPRPRSCSPATGCGRSSRSTRRSSGSSACPNPTTASDGIVEIRPVFEADDFGEELTPELREREAAPARADRGAPSGAWRPTSTARSTPSGGSSRRG